MTSISGFENVRSDIYPSGSDRKMTSCQDMKKNQVTETPLEKINCFYCHSRIELSESDRIDKNSNPVPERTSVKALLSTAHNDFILERFLTTFFICAEKSERTFFKTTKLVFADQNFLEIFGRKHLSEQFKT